MSEHQPGDFERVPLETRVLRYYELSEDAFSRAERAAMDADREQYAAMGMAWRSLAEETEAVLKRLRGLNLP
jgi:hypothetical protein